MKYYTVWLSVFFDKVLFYSRGISITVKIMLKFYTRLNVLRLHFNQKKLFSISVAQRFSRKHYLHQAGMWRFPLVTWTVFQAVHLVVHILETIALFSHWSQIQSYSQSRHYCHIHWQVVYSIAQYIESQVFFPQTK